MVLNTKKVYLFIYLFINFFVDEVDFLADDFVIFVSLLNDQDFFSYF